MSNTDSLTEETVKLLRRIRRASLKQTGTNLSAADTRELVNALIAPALMVISPSRRA
jgi:hypothetical protein